MEFQKDPGSRDSTPTLELWNQDLMEPDSIAWAML